MDKPRLEQRPETRALTVETLLQYARAGKIRIPDFQRPLRWRSTHVVDLFDSIYRGFPIGELLLSKREAKAERLRFGPFMTEAPGAHDALFVVDGQQRIIALAGAMLRPDKHPRGDIHAVWFDLEDELFVRLESSEPPPHWIPLNVAGDTKAVLGWLDDWPFRKERPDLRDRVFDLSKSIREYQIPAYIVEGATEDVLRVIFKRVNNSGVAMRESEVFEALFEARGPHPVRAACARLQEGTGFGDISPEWFLRCLEVVEGMDLRKTFAQYEDDATDLAAEAVEHTEDALRRAIAFLCEDAGFPHSQLVPYRLPLVVLARFFHLYPTPHPRTRTLLTRWTWRGALSGGHGDSSDATVQRLQSLIQNDEFASVERLLETVPSDVDFPAAATGWYGQSAKVRLCATAMVHMRPLDPETRRAYKIEDVQTMLASPTRVKTEGRAIRRKKKIGDIFIDVSGDRHVNVARAVLLSNRRRLEQLMSWPPEVLASHGIDEKALRALQRDDIDAFAERRARVLDRYFQSFFSERIARGDSDRPPIGELSRRANARVVAHERA